MIFQLGIKGEVIQTISIIHFSAHFQITWTTFNLSNFPNQTKNSITMMKIAVLFALVAVATAAPGVLLAAGQLPASTGPLTYAAPLAVAHAAPVAVAHAAPIAVAHAAPVAIPAPIAYQSGVKVTHTVEPVEQHGYQIAY